MSYRPITDVWLLVRTRLKYYGAYPYGFLSRARSLLGVTINDPVLHVCSGKVRDYPYKGVGPNDKTVDLNPDLFPDFMVDVNKEIPKGFKAILADPPYSEEDAKQYGTNYPEPNALLRRCLDSLESGQRVGILHYFAPRPPKGTILVALVAVLNGYKNRCRVFSVYEKP